MQAAIKNHPCSHRNRLIVSKLWIIHLSHQHWSSFHSSVPRTHHSLQKWLPQMTFPNSTHAYGQVQVQYCTDYTPLLHITYYTHHYYSHMVFKDFLITTSLWSICSVSLLPVISKPFDHILLFRFWPWCFFSSCILPIVSDILFADRPGFWLWVFDPSIHPLSITSYPV